MSYKAVGQDHFGALGASERIDNITETECNFLDGEWRDGGCWTPSTEELPEELPGECYFDSQCPSGRCDHTTNRCVTKTVTPKPGKYTTKTAEPVDEDDEPVEEGFQYWWLVGAATMLAGAGGIFWYKKVR